MMHRNETYKVIMSDPFTDPKFQNTSSSNKDSFSDFVSFDQFGKDKKKVSKWTGFKQPSQMETQFKNFDFNSGTKFMTN
jgi:hypothetical protein